MLLTLSEGMCTKTTDASVNCENVLHVAVDGCMGIKINDGTGHYIYRQKVMVSGKEILSDYSD